MVQKNLRQQKVTDILTLAQKAFAEGKFIPVHHAKIRLNGRQVTIQEVQQAVKNGFHEKKKDSYKPEHGGWNYSIRGKTINGRTLRIILAIDSSGMLIITVIDLDKR